MNEIIEKIKSAKSAAILGHINADADSLGSCFAFARMMRIMGKRADVYTEEPIERYLRFISSDYIVYDPDEPTEQYDLCICLDCGDIDRLGKRRIFFDNAAQTINIDHHRTNTEFAQANMVDGDASATGEILCGLFEEFGYEIDKEIARYLYIAISSDTGCFKYSSVSPYTMRCAAKLLEYDFDHAEIARLLFDTHSMEETRFRAEVMRNIRSYDGGRIRIVSISPELCEKTGLDENDIPNVVDIPRCVEGTEIAVALKLKNGEVRINLRSNSDADVSKVALKFGGGGHVKAAGAGIKGVSLEEAEKIVLEACREVLA